MNIQRFGGATAALALLAATAFATPATHAAGPNNADEKSARVVYYGDGRVQHRDEQSYAWVKDHGTSLIVSGNGESIPIDALKRALPGDFLWLRDGERTYVIVDPALLASAANYWAPYDAINDKLSATRAELRKQEAALALMERGASARGAPQNDAAATARSTSAETPWRVQQALVERLRATHAALEQSRSAAFKQCQSMMRALFDKAIADGKAHPSPVLQTEHASPPSPPSPAQSPAETAPQLASPHYGSWGFDLAGMDTSVRPGDDFFDYANGAWNAHTVIPADAVRVGYFANLDTLAAARTRQLVEAAAADPSADATRAKIGAMYRSFMDEARLERLSALPLRADLRRLRAIDSRAALAAFMGDKSVGFGGAPFTVVFGADMLASDRYAVYVSQGGLGMPNRDYYLDDQHAAKKTAYQRYVGALLALAGWDAPPDAAAAVTAFETRIATVSWTLAALRDTATTYKPSSTADLERSAPGFAWTDFMAAAGLPAGQRLIAASDTSLSAIAAIMADTPIATLKAWEAFHIVDGGAPYLSRAFADARFAFRSTTLAGQPTPAPRWQRGVAAVNGTLGAAVGQLYVDAFLTPAAVPAMRRLVDNLHAALAARITQLTWMSGETKAEAQRKLANFEVQIGAPQSARDYGDLVITDDDLYGNVVRAARHDWRRQLALLDAPWDKSAWRFWPQDATAYTENGQLIFTAGMLEAPFFDPQADPAINYGTMGAVIGHELTHGFDDQGRHVDAQRRQRDWWSADDAARFEAQATRLATQFSATEVLPGLRVNGAATLGENIADLGGLTIALAAYHLSLDGRAAPVLDGFSGDQRVFLGWAQGWRQKMREDALRRQVATDVHSPARARVNGMLRNMDAWVEAFHVRPGDALYLAPADRVRIW